MVPAEAIERPAIYHAFIGFLIHHAWIYPAGEFKDSLVRPVFPALCDNIFNGFTSHPLNTSHAKTHFSLFINCELKIAFVYIRTKYRNAQPAAFIHKKGNIFDVILGVEYRSHEFRRIMSLQVSRLVGHKGITGGMRLIKGIGCKGFPISPYLIADLRVVTTLFAAFGKPGLHLIQDVL